MKECYPFEEHDWKQYKHPRGNYRYYCEKCKISTALTPEMLDFINANKEQFRVLRGEYQRS
jgi:hypothetical protein